MQAVAGVPHPETTDQGTIPAKGRGFSFEESTEIASSRVWESLVDIEDWWLASNPEHEELRLLTPGPLRRGSRLSIRERIAGIPGEAEGIVTGFEPGHSVAWEATDATYRVMGLSFSVSEGVTWTVEETSTGKSRLSARVWARFRPGVRGTLFAWAFRLLGGIERDRRHARRELDYLRRRLETVARTDEER